MYVVDVVDVAYSFVLSKAQLIHTKGHEIKALVYLF